MTSTSISLPAAASVAADREFWRSVLTDGGFTAVPRWTLDPVPGVAAHETPVPGDLLAALRQRAMAPGRRSIIPFQTIRAMS